MIKQHLRMHGQSYRRHLINNLHFSALAIQAAAYTLGHGITPRISGKRASQLHNELWDLGRTLSIDDLTYRLDHDLYANIEVALTDYDDHAVLYYEQPRLIPFRHVIEQHFAHRS